MNLAFDNSAKKAFSNNLYSDLYSDNHLTNISKEIKYPLNLIADNIHQREHEIRLQKDAFIIDGKRKILRGGSLQWFKLPKEVWEDRILRFKSAGYNTIDMYVSWKNHEKKDGVFDFEKFDIKYFLELAKKHDMFVVFRPGPYICNEIDSGGLPGWLIPKSNKHIYNTDTNDGFVNIRTNEKDFMDYVQRYYSRLNKEILPYLHSNGGPIILYSVENEYDWYHLLSKFDKYSTLNNLPERPFEQKTDTKTYLEQLSKFARTDGINIPILTCPGSAKISGLENARDVLPMPNMYTGLKNAEYQTVKLIEDMHSDKYDGLYKNMPVGLTETNREANYLKRLVLGGMNSVLQFNNIGYFQNGYQNAILFNGFLVDNIKDTINVISKMFDRNSPNTAFLRPGVGLFPGKGDYFGSAITPSGLFRDNFYNLRRVNLFINSFEEHIAKGYKAFRTSNSPNLPRQNKEIMVRNNQTGIRDPDNTKINSNYWLKLGNKSALLGIYNNGWGEKNLGKESVFAFGNVLPKYTDLIVPTEYGITLDSQKNLVDREYTMFIPINFPISQKSILAYSTSEVLSLNDFNNEKLLILYGKKNVEGEFKIEGNKIQITSLSPSIKVNESSENGFTLSYKHGNPHSISYQDENGDKTRIVILDTYMAGKTWFADTKNGKVMISGAEYLQNTNNNQYLEFSSHQKNDNLIIYSEQKLRLPDTYPIKTFDKLSGISILKVDKTIPFNHLKIDISKGKIMRDNREAYPDYDTKTWISLGDKPAHLENHNIYNGHAWYRANFFLNEKDLIKRPSLWIEQAGDFQTIYINGKYVTTLTPIGCEINNNSSDKAIKFTIPREFLKEGENVIAFKSEIWGHGGILIPQGTINRGNLFGKSFEFPFVKLKVPAMSYDSKKGLSGDAKFNDKPLYNWKLRPKLSGNIEQYSNPSFDDSKWADSKVPIELQKGDVIWYRTTLNKNDIPNNNNWFTPLALKLKGTNAKATIFLNGKLIGRWISDNEWLKRGGWFQPTKDMWTDSSTDEFPIPMNILKKGNNIFSIAFEDTSQINNSKSYGEIQDISICIANEISSIKSEKNVNIPVIHKRIPINNYL